MKTDAMTVEELMQILERLPRDKVIQIGTMDMACGVATGVKEYEGYVEILSDESVM